MDANGRKDAMTDAPGFVAIFALLAVMCAVGVAIKVTDALFPASR